MTMTWATYLLGQHWPAAATILVFAVVIILLTSDRRTPP